MEWLVLASKIGIALALLNVWLVRAGTPTAWRGGNAQNMLEEFAAYGLPAWSMAVVGFLKVTLAILLLVSIWLPVITRPAVIGIAILMLGAVSMRLKVRDPIKKALPALTYGPVVCGDFAMSWPPNLRMTGELPRGETQIVCGVAARTQTAPPVVQ